MNGDDSDFLQRAIVAQLLKEAHGASSPTAKASNLRALSDMAARLDTRQEQQDLGGFLRPAPDEDLKTVSHFQQKILAAMEALPAKLDRARRLAESDPVLAEHPDMEQKRFITRLFGDLKAATAPAVYSQAQHGYGDSGLAYLTKALAVYARAELAAELAAAEEG